MQQILTADGTSNESEHEVDPDVADAIREVLELELEHERQSNPPPA
jgi:hypothetical protein